MCDHPAGISEKTEARNQIWKYDLWEIWAKDILSFSLRPYFHVSLTD